MSNPVKVMTPDQVLGRMRSTAKRVVKASKEEDAKHLANLVMALDKHLANGGELPSRWDFSEEDDELDEGEVVEPAPAEPVVAAETKSEAAEDDEDEDDVEEDEDEDEDDVEEGEEDEEDDE